MHLLTSFVCLFSGPPVEHVREVAQALRAIGDELDKDESLQQYCQAYCSYFYDIFPVNRNSKYFKIWQRCELSVCDFHLLNITSSYLHHVVVIV